MKKILLLMLFYTSVSTVMAQENPPTIQDEIDHFFAPLNLEDLSTGILLDKTISFSDIQKYNGVNDTTCSYSNWEQLYLELYNATLDKEQILHPTEIEDRINKIPALGVVSNYTQNISSAGISRLQSGI